MAPLTERILVWFLLWILGGGTFVLLVRWGTDYINRFYVTALFFTLVSLGIYFVFDDLLAPPIAVLRPFHLAAFLGVAALQLFGYKIAHHCLQAPTRMIETHPYAFFLRMDLRYLVSKPFEILFQQSLVVSLILLLEREGLGYWEIFPICALLFGAIHLPIIKLVGRFFGLYYLLSSLVASMLFPLLVLHRPDGFVLAFLVHWLYYLASALYFWVRPVPA